VFTLVFGKRTLVSKMVNLRDQPVNLGAYCVYVFQKVESMNVLDVKYECNRRNQTRVKSVEVNC
jgi:hypothetical protein